MCSFFVFTYLYFFIWYLLSLQKKDFSIFDLAWGGGVILPAFIAFFSRVTPVKSLLIVLIFLWAARLTLHLTRRYQQMGEDRRYKAWMQIWGNSWRLQGFFKVFFVQATIAVIVIIPALSFILSDTESIATVSYLGSIISGFGLSLETIADYQLEQFKLKKSPQPFLREGVWRYSRHPNYVGEVLFWWGIWVFCIPSISYWTVICPLILYLVIRYVSGVPLVEQAWKAKPSFATYEKEIPIFWPWK
jgi:steroid 5-alpha reductase family enzyme